MIKKRAIKRPKISVIIPVYNEQENIFPLSEKLKLVLEKMKVSYEIIFVDDGSVDRTLSEAYRVASKNKKIIVVELSRNFGQTAAMAAGFESSSGEIIVTLDGDGQNDPKDIPKLIRLIDKGFDLVSGWRRNRKDKFVTRKIPSFIANKIISLVSGLKLHDFGCSLKAYRREILDEIPLYGEMHRFIPAVAVGVGAKITEVVVAHHPRKFGKSKYGLSRIMAVVLDVLLLKFLLSFQSRPMRFFGGIGMFFSSLGSIVFLELTYEKFILLKPLSQRPLFLVSIFLIMIGIQFVMIGIFAEMLMRVYFESSGKKIFYIRKRNTK